ncbi:putative NADH dehydrogenase [Scophthalmus maximus]|uniref:Putative NADH dehydrogenase n=1 Tax=Scophthalmus maximus TaxID=52904 RepID=A0A2U9BFN4_SCOMX|nr:putative NADH dehydrogenase [Scophthalmus maximus]
MDIKGKILIPNQILWIPAGFYARHKWCDCQTDKHAITQEWRKLITSILFLLIPQFFFTTLGITGAILYLIRLSRGPHVTFWNKTDNPEPWNKLDPTYQYKFVAIKTDYKGLKKEGPDF